MVGRGCHILEVAVGTSNHPGYMPQYIRRLLSDFFNTYGTIEYELNVGDHGKAWYEKADLHRRQLIDDDLAESWDLQVMATVDGNIALSQMANQESSKPAITAYNLLIDTFGDKQNRGPCASNASIAYRLEGCMELSLQFCEKAHEWTREAFGDDSLSMAMQVSWNIMTQERLIRLQCTLQYRKYLSGPWSRGHGLRILPSLPRDSPAKVTRPSLHWLRLP